MRSFLKSFWPPIVVTLAACVGFFGRPPIGIAQDHVIYVLWANLYWLTVLMWIVADARLRGKTPCYEFGFFLYMTFPASILWYVVRSRGVVKGILLLLLILLLAILPDMVATAAWPDDID